MSQSGPLISIIIPSLNQGQFIGETISSIINQTYSNWEIIIVDGGSDDNTVDVIKSFENQIKYWVSEPDKGQAEAINKGLRKVEGGYCNWINSDDYLFPNALEKLVERIALNPAKEIFAGFTYCFFDETKEHSHTYRSVFGKKPEDVFFDLEMNQPGTFLKTEVFKALGGVNESLRYVFDNELFYRYVISRGLEHIDYSDSLIAGFRLHGSSKSVADGFAKFNDEKEQILRWVYSNAPFESKMKIPHDSDFGKYISAPWYWNYGNWTRYSQRLLTPHLLSLFEINPRQRMGQFIWGLMKGLHFPITRKNISILLRLVFRK